MASSYGSCHPSPHLPSPSGSHLPEDSTIFPLFFLPDQRYVGYLASCPDPGGLLLVDTLVALDVPASTVATDLVVLFIAHRAAGVRPVGFVGGYAGLGLRIRWGIEAAGPVSTGPDEGCQLPKLFAGSGARLPRNDTHSHAPPRTERLPICRGTGGWTSVLDLEETFIYDAVTHAYNMAPSNYRNQQHAQGISEMLFGNVSAVLPDQYTLTADGFVRDWGVEETARMLFEESHTDMATFHPVPMYAFHDGLVANEKAAAVVDRWPDRFRSYACVDPLREGWEDELEAQASEFDPIGVKLYPSHWTEDDHEGWSMGDPDVAFPVFEKAKAMGIDLIDIHKAIPFGPVPRAPYHPGDVDEAAASFPDLTFSIVHGGYSFTEETAWQLARFPNVYVNLEGLPAILLGNERRFGELLGELIGFVGELGIERLFWSSGAMSVHPRPQLEAFRDFQFSDEVRKNASMLGELPQLTDEHKRMILGENYADLIGLDIDEAQSRIEGDQFDRATADGTLAQPFTTTAAEVA